MNISHVVSCPVDVQIPQTRYSPNSTWPDTHDMLHNPCIWHKQSWHAVSRVSGSITRHDKSNTQQRTQHMRISLMFRLVHYVKIITLMLSLKNVIDTVHSESNLNQMGRLWRKMTIIGNMHAGTWARHFWRHRQVEFGLLTLNKLYYLLNIRAVS